MVRKRHTSSWTRYKRAFLSMSKQKDFEILKSLFELGKYFGVCPMNKFEEHKSTMKNLLCSILFLTHLAKTMVLMVTDEVDLFYVLRYLNRISMLLFIAGSVLRPCFTTRSNWNSFQDCLNKIEHLLSSIGFRTHQRKLKLWMEIYLILSLYLIWFIHTAKLFITSPDRALDWYIYFSIAIYMVYCIVFYLYIRMTSEILVERYGFVRSNLEFLGVRDGGELFKTLTKFLKLADLVVREANTIFGWQFFFFSISSIFFVLHNIMNFLFGASDWELSGRFTFHMLMFTMTMVSMVMSCDALEKGAIEVTSTCYKLHLRSNNSEVKKKLLQIAKYSRQVRPTFSAAGFFDIRQIALKGMFSTIISFAVPFIQFNMALSK